ncbi:MAG: GntR family transcriptional regulator [Deltaproteobacteria bacterium]|nr:GntR family transcriptional regulator [Deltaproteobacteria bacterium]
MNHSVYSIIRDRILYLEYEPGKILNEKILAQEFGISRTPVRDVLNRLEWDQLVRIIPRTGSMVTEINECISGSIRISRYGRTVSCRTIYTQAYLYT